MKFHSNSLEICNPDELKITPRVTKLAVGIRL